MNRINFNWNPLSQVHDSTTLRVYNLDSTFTLTITNVSIDKSNYFTLPIKEQTQTPISIVPNGYTDFVVKFIESEGEKGIRSATLTLQTNLPQQPEILVHLRFSLVVVLCVFLSYSLVLFSSKFLIEVDLFDLIIVECT